MCLEQDWAHSCYWPWDEMSFRNSHHCQDKHINTCTSMILSIHILLHTNIHPKMKYLFRLKNTSKCYSLRHYSESTPGDNFSSSLTVCFLAWPAACWNYVGHFCRWVDWSRTQTYSCGNSRLEGRNCRNGGRHSLKSTFHVKNSIMG